MIGDEPTIEEFKTAIHEVSKQWNAMLYRAIKDETDRKLAGDIQYSNPIVSALQKNGSLEQFSDALQKVFALSW